MNSLVKTSKAIKDSTSTGRMMIDAVERARDIYFGQIKRAEADLCDRIRRATDLIAGTPETSVSEVATTTEANTTSTPPTN